VIKRNTYHTSYFLVSFLFFTIFIYKPSFAQDKKDLNYYSKKKFESCEQLIEKKKFDEAIICLEQAIIYSNDKTKIFIRLAEINYLKKDKQKTLYFANKAIDQDANQALNPLKFLTKKIYDAKDDSLAFLIMNRLSVSNVKQPQLKLIEKTRDKIILKQNVDKNYNAQRKLITLGDSINSIESEYLPSTTLDENTMIFTRKIHGANEDFFVSYKDTNGVWSKAKNLGYPPNTSNPEGGAKISADGNYLFFTRCDMKSPDGIVGGGCDLVFCYKEDDTTWSAPQYFGFTINTTGFEGQPCLSSNNKDLYFASNREGGYGGMDIFVSHFNENGYWTKPVNLGPNINTSGNEITPFIHADNETFYFSSDGHVGLGMSDIFVCKKINDSTWTKPFNVGHPINSEKVDGGLVVSANGKFGYIGSDNIETKGLIDIFKVELNDAIKPLPTVCFKGRVLDKKRRKYLKNIEVNIVDETNRFIVNEQYSNRGDASFMFALHRNKNYFVTVKEEGYRYYKYKLPFKNDTIKDIEFKKIKLKKIGEIDTLFNAKLKLDSTNKILDSTSRILMDSIVNSWKKWNEDEATVYIYINHQFYYRNDTDSLYQQNIIMALEKLKAINYYFELNHIDCVLINENTQAILRKKNEEENNDFEIVVVEHY
jgi:hypothetical protein